MSRHIEDGLGGAIRGMPTSGLRLNNERAVLTAVGIAPGSSGAEITRATGLGAQTVSRLLVDLENMGLVIKGEPRRGARGQPAIPIHLNPEGAFCIGCEMGWRHIEILIQNLSGEILGRHRRDYAFPDRESIFEEIGSLAKLMSTLVPERSRHRLLGMGLATPSGFERNMALLGAPKEKISEWNDVDLALEAGKATGLDVYLYNDGNAGCWGELAATAVPRPRNLAYILVSTFVGAGLMAEGRLFEGPNGRSANLGSMMVSGGDGGRQYVHLIASLVALERKLGARGVQVPRGNPLNWDWEALEPVASEWIKEAGEAIAKVIVNTSAVVELELAVIDGVMPKAIVERLVEVVRNSLAATPALTSEWPDISMGKLGNAAPALGASWLPMYRRYFSRERSDVLFSS